jgi:hypothetical protein
MAAPRYCDSCGAELLAGARFCEACGAAVPHDAPARAAVPAATPSLVPAPRQPAQSDVVEPPTRPGNAPLPRMPQPTRRSGTRLLLALAALVLAGAVGVWYLVQPLRPTSPSAPPVATQGEQPAPPPAERPPARAPVTRADIESLKAAVEAANRAHVQAIFAGGDPPPELRVRQNQAVGALGQALYRHHVEDGKGDLAAARAEMRSFLEGLNADGLGLSEPVIDAGVASVAP